MNALFSRRTRRTTAWLMLLVWLFALSAGMANACLLEPQGTHGHARPAIDERQHVTAGHEALAHADDARDAGLDTNKAPCLKVCDEAPQSPVNAKSVSDVDRNGPDLAQALLSPWSMPLAVEGRGAHILARARTSPPGRPPRVRFSRLTL